jgi:hypothetical protein
MQALLCALALVGLSQTSHSAWPLIGAGVASAYAIAGPPQLSAAVRPGPLVRLVGRIALFLAFVAGVAVTLSYFVNSGIPALALVGNVLFICLLAATTLTIGVTLWPRAARLLAVVARTSCEAANGARERLSLAVALLSLARR